MSKDIFAEAAAERQRLLDYIKQHGECVHVQLARFSGDTPGNVMRKMRLMEANGEVKITQYSRVYLLTALKDTVMSGEEMRRHAKAKKATTRHECTAKPTTQVGMCHPVKGKPWLVRNVGDRQPIRNPDAMQGAGYRGMTQLEATA